MAFLLHLLRPGDLFLDIGANVGSYTVLASKVCGARTIAFEPDPATANALRKNIDLNGISQVVTVKIAALGACNGEIAFTRGLDTMNRVARAQDQMTQTVPIMRLDDIPEARMPILIKMDVEGFEDNVLAGASHVLSSPSLLAVQSEAGSPEVESIMRSYGFEMCYYEPAARTLQKSALGQRMPNFLFVRNFDTILARLAQGPVHSVLGIQI